MSDPLNPQAVDKLLETILGQFDSEGGGPIRALAELRELKAMERVLLQLELRRMQQKHGDDDPRVELLATRLRQNLAVLEDLGVESDISVVEEPAPVEKGAVVFGRVVDSKKRGLAGLLVSLTRVDGTAIRTVPRVETATSGAYIISVTPAVLDRSLFMGEEGVLVQVSGPTGKQIHSEREPVQLQTGGRTTVNIVIGAANSASPSQPQPGRVIVTPIAPRRPNPLGASPESEATGGPSPDIIAEAPVAEPPPTDKPAPRTRRRRRSSGDNDS